MRLRSCRCPLGRNYPRWERTEELPQTTQAGPWRGRETEYRAWQGMRQRCLNPNATGYTRYGGRGIKVCSEWLGSFDAFYGHVGPRPGTGFSLDRINNDGNYEPGNVRWATHETQARNKSRARGWRYVRPAKAERHKHRCRRCGIPARCPLLDATCRERNLICGKCRRAEEGQ
jgi:hypothetical protein